MSFNFFQQQLHIIIFASQFTKGKKVLGEIKRKVFAIFIHLEILASFIVLSILR